MAKPQSPWRDLYYGIFLTGIVGGLALGVRDVVTHDHLGHGMARLALLAVRDAVNLGLLAAALIAVLVLAARTVFPRVWEWVFSGSIEVRFPDPPLFVSRLTAGLGSAIVWASSVLVVNRLILPTRFTRFHPVALAVDFGLLVVATGFFWVLSQQHWMRGSPFIRRVLRASTLGLLVAVVVLNGFVLSEELIRRPAGPNVVLIVVDTLRADHLGSIEPTGGLTPNLDRLASHGWLFPHAISPAPWTTPAIASIMTSQYPRVLGISRSATVVGNRFVTLAEAFRDAGYDTGGIVSHTFVSSKLGFGQGFELWDEESAGGHGSVSSPLITDKGLAFATDSRDRAFFLFLHYFDPHYDFIHHDGHGPVLNSDSNVSSGESIQSLRLKASSMTGEDIAVVRALYESEVSFTDQYLGRFLDGLERAGLYDDTIIIFAADHGEEFCERGDHWIGHTRTLYQEVIHVPLIIKPVGEKGGRTFEQFVGLIDAAPTILDLAGITIPRESRPEGSSLRRLDEPGAEARPVFSATRRDDHLQSVILSGKKLIHRPVPNVYELYDLVDDPSESDNLAKDDPQTLRLLGRILDDWERYIEHSSGGATVEQPQLTNEQKQMLRSLGYL